MNFLYYFVLTVILLFSCQGNKQGEENVKIKEESQECKKKSYNSFNDFKINDIQASEFNIDKFIENNREPDSIKDGYYFYGKSNFLFEKNKITFVEIVDEELYFNDFLSIGTSFQIIKNRYPCSFKNKTEYHNTKSEAISLYSENYNRIKIFVSNEKVLGIIYMINEPDFDTMN